MSTTPARAFHLIDATSARPDRWRASVWAATVLALALRLVAVNAHSFWYDEAVAAELTGASYTQLLTGEAKDNGNPPLYWMLAKAWGELFGHSEVALRSLSVLLGAAAVPLLAALGRRLLNPSAGLLAAGLLAISPVAIELSNEARTYALAYFLGILSTWLLVRWIDTRSRRDLLLYAASVLLTCHSHYFAMAVPAAHGLGVLASPRRRELILPWAGAAMLAAVLWLPWLPSFGEQLHQPGNLSRMGDRWKLQFYGTPVVFAVGRTFAWRESGRAMLLLATAGSLAAFWWPAARGLARLRRDPSAGAVLGGWWLIPVLGPLALALAASPLYHARAGSIALPAFLLLMAWGLESFRPLTRGVLLAVVLAMSAVSIAHYALEPLKDDWRSATPAVLRDLGPDEPVAFDTSIEVASLKYYVPRSGPMPRDMVGLVTGPDPRGRLSGVRYRDGLRIDRDVRDYTDRLFDAPAVRLVLCVPAGSADQYEALFRGRGFTVADVEHFHRIDVYRFRKEGGAKASGGEAGDAKTHDAKTHDVKADVTFADGADATDTGAADHNDRRGH